MGISLECFKVSGEILINPQDPPFVTSRRCCGTAGMGSARKGQKEKGFAGQKCFSLGRELRAGGSEIPIIPKLCLHPAGSVGLFPQGLVVDLGTSHCREPIFWSGNTSRDQI